MSNYWLAYLPPKTQYQNYKPLRCLHLYEGLLLTAWLDSFVNFDAFTFICTSLSKARRVDMQVRIFQLNFFENNLIQGTCCCSHTTMSDGFFIYIDLNLKRSFVIYYTQMSRSNLVTQENLDFLGSQLFLIILTQKQGLFCLVLSLFLFPESSNISQIFRLKLIGNFGGWDFRIRFNWESLSLIHSRGHCWIIEISSPLSPSLRIKPPGSTGFYRS
jgi:hypothetical protein